VSEGGYIPERVAGLEALRAMERASVLLRSGKADDALKTLAHAAMMLRRALDDAAKDRRGRNGDRP